VKVFFLVYGLTSGGIERIAINVYKYIDKSKFDINLITKYNKREFFDDELEAYGGKRVPLLSNCKDRGLMKRIKLALNIPKVMKDGYEIGYFNLNAPKDAFKYPLLGKVMGMKYIIIHSHNSSEDKGSILNRLINKFGRLAIDIIANKKLTCSEKAAVWMYSKKTIQSSDYIQINNGIDMGLFGYDKDVREKLRRQLGIQDKFVVGHVGRFSPQKNHKFLVNIFGEIHKINPNSCLLLLGTGSMVEEIRIYVEQCGLSDSIKFMGAQSNVHEYMQAFDVFLLPSIYEGLPVVGIEAQSAGLRCFFSNRITESADITGNVNFLSLEEDAEIWAQKIVQECSEYLRKDVSDVIKRHHFDVESSVKAIEKAMREMFK